MFNLKINNFRSFKNEALEFSRFNILIGENSGGKSSLIKFLLSLKQTLENPLVSNLILSGKYADVGNYKECIYNQDEELNINFEFSFGEDLKSYYAFFFQRNKINEKRKKIDNSIQAALNNNTTAKFTISKNLDTQSSLSILFSNDYLGELELRFDMKSNDDAQAEEIIGEPNTCSVTYHSRTRNKTFAFDNIEYTKKGFLAMVETYSLKRHCIEYGEPDLLNECAVFLITQNLIEYHLGDLRYINPLQSSPKRIYINRDAQSEYENADLDKFANLITTKQISPRQLVKFNSILRDFGISDGVKVNSPKNLPVSEIRIKVKNLISNISDVGYGVSLQIPIIFEAFLAEQEGGSTFIIEQPEVHLHPKLHAKFIETLVMLGPSNNYIIETHSEHLVRMLQVLVKNRVNELEHNDVNIWYFTRMVEKFKISPHQLNSAGEMVNSFPSGFYDTSYLLNKKMLFSGNSN